MPEKIHDKGYKRILSKKSNFLNLLKSFVDKDWVKHIREEDLTLVDKSFVPKDFKEKEADIIYELRYNDKKVIFYFLLELQSGVDFTMPFRLLVYMTELLKRYFLNNKEDVRERKDYRLPAVIPIVLYNGADKWTAVRSFKEYLKGYEAFEESVIDFKYILIDVNNYTDEQLIEIKNLISAVFALDKKSNDMEDFIKKVSMGFKIFTGLTGDEQIDFMEWTRDVLAKKVKADKDNLKVVNEFLKQLMKGDEVAMNYAIERFLDEVEEKGIEKGIEKGRQEGIEKGIEKGRQEGIKEGRIQVARLLYKKGMGKDEIISVTELTPEEIQCVIEDL